MFSKEDVTFETLDDPHIDGYSLIASVNYGGKELAVSTYVSYNEALRSATASELVKDQLIYLLMQEARFYSKGPVIVDGVTLVEVE